MLLKACNRCGNLIPYGSAYCSTCAPIIEAMREEQRRESNRRYNKTRDPKYWKFYNSIDWRTLSDRYTQDKGYTCECCGLTLAQILMMSEDIKLEVHHKIPIQTPEGWIRRLDYNNLELLCTDCHNKRHGRFQKKKVRR